MTSVLRRIEAPTRYGGLPVKGWLAVAAAVICAALIVTVFKTPLAPTLVGLSWLVISPTAVLVLWAHQQGVSVPTLIVDFARYAARRRRHELVHHAAAVLRGGIALSGPMPGAADADPGWSPAVDLEEVL